MATDDSDVPDTGAVFTFGKSRFADNTANKFWIRNDEVVQITCGDDHTAFITESGRIFAFGANEWGQLGLGHTKSTNKPGSIKALKQEGVAMVGCGRLHTIVYTKRDRLYSFGAGGEGQLGVTDSQGYDSPQPIEMLADVKVKMISCGTEHSAVLTSDGSLYMFGSGSDGQLGLGENTETNVPTPLSIGVPIQHVSCGYYHTAIVTDEGRLYTFGENEFGKLGLNDDNLTFCNEPRPVDLIEGRVRKVSCGNNHTAVVTESGIVYTWGDGSSGQLGHGPSILQLNVPQKIMRLGRKKCIDVVCGENHTVVITDKGSLYTFGDGRHGKLCQGDESFSNLFHPTKVRRFKGFHVQQVSCGGCQTIVRARRKNLSNGDASSSSDEETNPLRMSGHMKKGLLAATLHNDEGEDCVDLGGSFDGSARGRRRQRETSPLPPLARTLPPLGSTKAGALPSLSATVPGGGRKLDQSLIPNIRHEQNEIHEELITKNEVTTVEASPRLNLLKNADVDPLESTHFSASKSVRELKPLVNAANGDLDLEDSDKRPETEGVDEPDTTTRPQLITKAGEEIVPKKENVLNSENIAPDENPLKTELGWSVRATKLENHDSGTDSEAENYKDTREDDKDEDAEENEEDDEEDDDEDEDEDEDDDVNDEDEMVKVKTKRHNHFADLMEPIPAPRRQTQARKVLEEEEDEDDDEEDDSEEDEDSEEDSEDEPEEQPSRTEQINGKTIKEVNKKSSGKGNGETTVTTKAAKQNGRQEDGDKKREENEEDDEEDDDDEDDDDEDEATNEDDEPSKKPAEDEDKDQVKKRKKETEAVKDEKEEEKDEQENEKNGQENEDIKQPDEPKAWQFWKKKPPPAKVNKSSASVSSEDKPVDQNRSKTCSIL